MISDQIELFDVGERRAPTPGATPSLIGSGPDGETCRTCKNAVRLDYHDKAYWKCGLMRSVWTHGAASDIKLKWPACGDWCCTHS